jgi:hypothetical protein
VLRINLGVNRPYQVVQSSISKLPTPRLERLPDSLPAVEAVCMEGAVALVRTYLPAARPKELAGLEMSPECVKLDFCFHDVDITSKAAKSVD